MEKEEAELRDEEQPCDLLIPIPISSSQLKIEKSIYKSSQNYGYVYYNLGCIFNPSYGYAYAPNIVIIGKFPLFYPPEHYHLPNITDLIYSVNWIESFLLSYKIVRVGDVEKRAKVRALSRDLLLSYGFTKPCTSDSIRHEKSLINVTLILLIFITDDLIEETNLLHRNPEDSFMVCDYIVEMANSGQNLNPEEFSMFPSLRPSAKAAQALIAKLEVYVPDFKSVNGYYIEAVKETYSAVLCLQMSMNLKGKDGTVDESEIDKEAGKEPNVGNGNEKENKKEGKAGPHKEYMSEDTYKYLRGADVAALCGIELLAIFKGIKIDPNIRDNLLFKRLQAVTKSIVAIQNDLVGLKRDLDKNELNLVLFKYKSYRRKYNNNPAKLEQKANLNYCYGQVVKYLGFLVDELNYLVGQLKSFFPEDDELEEYLQIVYSVIDTLGYLFMYTTRYGELNSAFTTNTK